MNRLRNLTLDHPFAPLFCAGCFAALAMAPVYFWPALLMGYAWLVSVTVKEQRPLRAALLTFLFFFGYFLTSLYWVSASLFVEFNRWWWALPFAFAGLPVLCALFPATTVFIVAWLAIRFRIKAPLIRGVLIAGALAGADILRAHLFTGFPWNMPLHAFVDIRAVTYLLPLTGFYSVNTALIFLCAAGFIAFQKRAYLSAYAGILLMVYVSSIFFLPKHVQHENPVDRPVIMVQANIPQNEKWNPDYITHNMRKYIDMSRSAIKDDRPYLLIWPETALSRTVLSRPQQRLAFEEFMASLPDGSLLITGYLTYENNSFFNALAVFDTTANMLYRYDKHHLVPFGEYMPLGLETITGFTGFEAGPPPAPASVGSLDFIPLICYEIIFPRYVDMPEHQKASFILNITNDAWFGHTAGPYQHFDHARFRAMESETPIFRLSGNGISGVIGGNGTVLRRTSLNGAAIVTF